MHGNHPAGFQIEECSGGIARAGVNVAEVFRIVGANRQQGHLGREALANFAKAVEVGGISGVIDRMFSGSQHVPAVSAVRIFDHARAPVPRREHE